VSGSIPDPTRSAVVLIDLLNDFLHPDGAYARGGRADAHLAALPAHIAPLLPVARDAGAVVVFSRFTIWPGRVGEPLVAEHLLALRPFLRPGDFAPDSWGQRTVDVLGEPDLTIDKVSYSAFAHTRLGWWLGKVGVDQVVLGGIVTNGGVASTARDAHGQDLGVTLMADGCGAFDRAVHDATLTSLGSVAPAVTVADVIAGWTDR